MAGPEVLFERKGYAGIITLNRPAALNAVTLNMVREMHPMLEAWARDDAIRHVIIKAAGGKAFSAGGDIRQLYEWGQAKDSTFLDFYREEYQLDTLIKQFPKPYIALMDGIAMGGGVGVSVNGSHRVGGENLTFAMPETGIGLFPDVGGTWFLPRCPGEIGMFLGLTGARLKAADALYAGIITHHVPSDCLEALEAALVETTDVDGCLEEFSQLPGMAPIGGQKVDIDRAFSADSIEEVLIRLSDMETDWAQKTSSVLQTKSPTSLKITYRQLREGARSDFEDCMRIEFRIVNRIFEAPDFFEGTRAVVIDKDMAPKWQPASLDQVSDEAIDAYFAPLENELQL